MKSILIKKIGTMDSGKFLCAIDKSEWERLQRREGLRKNAARRDATIKTILDGIEYVYGLPTGCLRFVKPDGKSYYIRSTKIQRIKKDYNDQQKA